MSDEDEGGGGEEGGAPAWMATFADLMSLLLTFFILILSFANMDVIKFSAAVDSLHDAFGTAQSVQKEQGLINQSPIDFNTMSRPNIVSLGASKGKSQSYNLHAELMAMVRRMKLQNLVSVEVEERGVVIRIIGQLLFDPGSVKLRPESFVLLREIARLIQALPQPVSIEGHTDDTPPGAAAGTNWHLSSGRAISVLEYLSQVHSIDPGRLSVAGFADTRPLRPNDSQESREINRRVEFVFHHPDEQSETRELSDLNAE